MAHPPPTSPSLSTLIDDCLVPVLSWVPLTDQLTSLPLTCTRWNSLLPLIHRQRSRLVIWNPSKSPNTNNLSLFPPTTRLPYTDYLISLFTLPNLNNLPNLNPDFLLRHTPLNPPLCQQLSLTFPHLTSLSLAGVSIHSQLLTALLSPYRTTLRTLTLDSSIEFVSNLADLRAFFDAIPGLLSLLNTMVSLRQLAICGLFCLIVPHSATYLLPSTGDRLVDALTDVLPRLLDFSLSSHGSNVFPLLQRLDETKLRSLSLSRTVWPDEDMLSRLVREKPGLKASLKHLTVGSFEIEGRRSGPLTLSSCQIIGESFQGLEYLEITCKTPLLDLLPALSCLKQLSHFKLIAYESLIERTPPWTVPKSQLATYRPLNSLQSLTLHQIRLEFEYLSLLGPLFPRVAQLYLDRCKFYSHQEGRYLTLPSDRPAGCSCKARLQEALATFHSLPQCPQ